MIIEIIFSRIFGIHFHIEYFNTFKHVKIRVLIIIIILNRTPESKNNDKLLCSFEVD